MGLVVGIDLGTTASAVAIPEQRLEKGLLVVRQCPSCSLVLDPHKRRTVPSVIAENERGEVVVGFAAKGRAGLTPGPIMFAKRFMGTNKTFPLNAERELRAEEVSAYILRYLKEMAEERLGVPVTEAVITVPAYFDLKAKQLTKEAGESDLVGLTVRQVVQEPVAAALTYCAKDPRENLKIMTYDLGGGTFDAAVVEKRDGTISSKSILAFDGDRYLGGYNFDTTLALWMADRLGERGYDIDASDEVTLARLMVYAERAKIVLSGEPRWEINERNSGITDANGKAVIIDLVLERGEFEDMIRSEVDYTLSICRRLLEEKGDRPITIDEIDEIVMVGGSSRIPLIQERLAAEFGKTPRLIEPDLCVVLGAALLAGMGVSRTPYLELHTTPRVTELPELSITGKVSTGEQLSRVADATVSLRTADGAVSMRRSPNDDGQFAFESVKLTPAGVTEFVLSVESPGRELLAEQRFSVRHSSDPDVVDEGPEAIGIAGQPVTNVLAKPIAIRMVDGPFIVAPERRALPFEEKVIAERADTRDFIHIAVLEGDNEIGSLRMNGVPESLPIGSKIEVSLKFSDDFRVDVKAHVPALKRDVQAEMHLPVPVQKSLDELRDEFDELRASAQDALSGAGRGALFADARAKKIRDLVGRIDAMFESHPDLPRIQDVLEQLRTSLQEASTGWNPDPPRAVFDGRAARLAQEIERFPAESTQAQEFSKRLSFIRQEAEGAYQKRDAARLKGSVKRLARLEEEVAAESRSGETEGNQPTPDQFLMYFAEEMRKLETIARENGRYDPLEERFREASDGLVRIRGGDADAMNRIRDWHTTKFVTLVRDVTGDEIESGEGGIPRLPRV